MSDFRVFLRCKKGILVDNSQTVGNATFFLLARASFLPKL
nr:MAG TPA: hypothetical protein [Caudoviricetes sp.]